MSLAPAAVDVVCWDWNGTLLDDVDVARTVMNSVLQERQLPVLQDRDAYRDVFGFPVRGFYSRLGIPDDDFPSAADRYLKLFAAEVSRARLHADAQATLITIGDLGIAQVLISATLISTLDSQLAPHAVSDHFAEILGITDIYAASKAHVVAAWLDASGYDPRRVLMVGDTNHDEEIADALTVQFLRFGNGHQRPSDHDRRRVVHHLNDVPAYLTGQRDGTPSASTPVVLPGSMPTPTSTATT